MRKQLSLVCKISWCLLFVLAGILSGNGQIKASASKDCLTGNCVCIQASLDFMNITASSGGVSASEKSRAGFNLGAFVLHPFPSSISTGALALKAGLEFVEKGSKYDDGLGDKETLALNYLEIPVDVVYEFKVPNCGAVFLGLGPYAAYGIGGKDKYTSAGQTVSTNSFTDSTGKRFDFGLSFTGGYQVSCLWSASIAYELGLINIYNTSNSGGSGVTVKNHGWSFNVAYCFGELFKK